MIVIIVQLDITHFHPLPPPPPPPPPPSPPKVFFANHFFVN